MTSVTLDPNMKQKVSISERSAALRYWHRRKARFVAAGLTSHGAEKRRRFRSAKERAGCAVTKFRERMKRLQAMGLTSRGTERIYRQPAPRLDKSDAVIVLIEIDQLAAAMARVFGSVPASVQAELIKVGDALGRIRRRVV